MEMMRLLSQPLRQIKRNVRQVRGWWFARSLPQYLAHAEVIDGWTDTNELTAIWHAARRLPRNAIIVEIGSFLGRSAVLLAGARKTAGNGALYCIDPFDGSGDEFSVPYYQKIAQGLGESIRQRFERNISTAGLCDWVNVRPGTAESVSATWNDPIDMIFLDGDQSPFGVRSAYESWAPFLKPGGTIAVHNSSDRLYSEGHDGHRRLVVESLHAPDYVEVACRGSTTFARRAAK